MLQGPGGKFPCVSTFLLETLSVPLRGERFLSPWMPVLSLLKKPVTMVVTIILREKTAAAD